MPSGEIELDWGDARHKFNISRIEQLLELEEKCGAGIGVIFNRLRSQGFYVNDMRETLRLGLIGGGMEPIKALSTVRRYFDARPLSESLFPAVAVLTAAMVGMRPDGAETGDDVGKKQMPEGASSPATADCAAANSTESVQPSDLPLDRSTSLPSGNSPPASTA